MSAFSSVAVLLSHVVNDYVKILEQLRYLARQQLRGNLLTAWDVFSLYAFQNY